jgi:hypothetical protein
MQTQKLIKKINSSYNNFLESYILWEKFSLFFSLPKIPIKWNENLINSFQSELKKISDKNEWFILNTISTQKWTIIDNIEFKDQSSYLKFINKNKDFEKFCNNLDFINTKLPIIKPWIEKNIWRINENDKKWNDILEVVKYFLLNSKTSLFIRELPVKVHTKFIENNKKIIDDILQFINSIDEEVFQFNWNTFEDKYFLKSKPNFIRFRFLDEKLKNNYNWILIDDIYLRIEDYKKLHLNCKKVFIVENEINYLTFPKVSDSIIIWWKWFNISSLKNTLWLQDKEIFYSWDLDSHWFKILYQCRKYFFQTKSIFMDLNTYNKFKDFQVEWKVLWNEEVKNMKNILTEEEYKLINYFNENKLRLEQENINLDYIIKILNL